MAGIAPESWLEWGLGAEGDAAPRPPEVDMLVAYDTVTRNSRKAQHKLGKLVNQGRRATHTASPDQLPETARPPEPDDPLGREAKPLAKARCRNLQGAGAIACLRAGPTDSLQVISAAKYVGIGSASWRLRNMWQ